MTSRGAHKAPVVHKWLLAHPRFRMHFTPTYSSWINQVERWFAELERRCLERGVFCSLDSLKAALEDWIKVWNDEARPFKWTKTADQILDRICRYCDRARVAGGGVDLRGTAVEAGHARRAQPVR
ncbi:transposase [Streptomyces sp. NPDC048420]|uniref:transposase n=1 Tax=Streptomyces sp. NPDC048420 TaxID=3155755 RepID=UPI0034168637